MSERHILQNRDSHIWSLRIALIMLVTITVVQLVIINNHQKYITVHIPPDLSKGALIKPGEYLAPSAYVFAMHVWKQLNDWPVSGKSDYKAVIEVNQCYLTPKFAAWLIDNFTQKMSAGELDRKRTVHSVKPFDEAMVSNQGANVYLVGLTLHLMEQLGKETIKDTAIFYPLRVVPDTRSCNKMGMALDGFYDEPKRVELESGNAK
jgi:integrating conjugative element protein (TIGR03746 family)